MHNLNGKIPIATPVVVVDVLNQTISYKSKSEKSNFSTGFNYIFLLANVTEQLRQVCKKVFQLFCRSLQKDCSHTGRQTNRGDPDQLKHKAQ